MKIAIVTDSVAYLTQEEVTAMNVSLLPLSIEFQGKVYVEGQDLTPTEFYQLVRGADTLPKSSQPSIGQTMTLFETLSNDYDAVLAITLSGDISGTHQTVQSLDKECNGMRVFALDSRRAAGAQADLVRRAYKLIQDGKTIEEILADLNQMIAQQTVYFIVDDLKHLQKGGRLSASSAFVGSMLNIKPILTIDGQITASEKVRSLKKALSKMVELVGQHMSKIGTDKQWSLTIHHGNALDNATQLKDSLQQVYPNVSIRVIEFGQTLGTHLGEGALGVTVGLDPTI